MFIPVMVEILILLFQLKCFEILKLYPSIFRLELFMVMRTMTQPGMRQWLNLLMRIWETTGEIL